MSVYSHLINKHFVHSSALLWLWSTHKNCGAPSKSGFKLPDMELFPSILKISLAGSFAGVETSKFKKRVHNNSLSTDLSFEMLAKFHWYEWWFSNDDSVSKKVKFFPRTNIYFKLLYTEEWNKTKNTTSSSEGATQFAHSYEVKMTERWYLLYQK